MCATEKICRDEDTAPSTDRDYLISEPRPVNQKQHSIGVANGNVRSDAPPEIQCTDAGVIHPTTQSLRIVFDRLRHQDETREE